MSIVQQINGKGNGRPTNGQRWRLYLDWCSAMDAAESAAAKDAPWQDELGQQAAEKRQLWEAADTAANGRVN